MLLILINWSYIFISSLSFGVLLKKLIKVENQNFTIHHILGLFFLSTFSWGYAIFFPLEKFFYSIVLVICFLSFLIFKREIYLHFIGLKRVWLSFNKSYRLSLSFIFIISLAMSSATPSIFDNESYYIQTIKWLNEYGLIKGLGNLHIFFAQTSSWHFLQASYSFSFLDITFNDLNGYFLIVFAVFCFQKLQEYESSKKTNDLYIGSVLLSLPFLIFFINAPSPDLPVFLISQIIFYLFIKHFKEIDQSSFIILLLLTLFVCFIKITACVLLLLPIILMINQFHILKKIIYKSIFFIGMMGSLFLIKNVILTGYLLYPLEILDIFNVDWKVPKEMIYLFKTGTYNAAFDYQKLEDFSSVQLVIAWLTSFKINGIINSIFVMLLLIFPCLWKFKNKEKSILVLYVIGILHFILAWYFSPQYRFFFFYMLFFSIQIFVWFVKKEKVISFFIYCCLLCSLIPFFTELKLSSYTTIKKTNINTSVLKRGNILKPNLNTSMRLEFDTCVEGDFVYNSPTKESFFWTTGNGPLPCVNVKQVTFIKKNYRIVPSLRTKSIKDGFKSLKLK